MTMTPNEDELWRSEAPREDLIRGLTPIRAEEDGNTMIGYPVVFEQWTEINSWEGHFMERVLPSGPIRSLKNGAKIRVQYNHGMSPHVGTSGLGKPRLMRPEERGVYTEVPLSNTSYNRDIIKPLLADGTLDGMSFRFSVIEDKWTRPTRASDHNPEKLPERDIVEFKWHEFGPVDWPAYEAAMAGIRSQAAFALWQAVPDEQRSALMRQFNISTEVPRIHVPGFLEREAPQADEAPPVMGEPEDGPLSEHPSNIESRTTEDDPPGSEHSSSRRPKSTRYQRELTLAYVEEMLEHSKRRSQEHEPAVRQFERLTGR